MILDILLAVGFLALVVWAMTAVSVKLTRAPSVTMMSEDEAVALYLSTKKSTPEVVGQLDPLPVRRIRAGSREGR